ncbi:MAG: hypothetical protein HPY83_16680 [Anaerolineae bacterium]|nr:hypothetical protein [Anaerolineae bacterium]
MLRAQSGRARAPAEALSLLGDEERNLPAVTVMADDLTGALDTVVKFAGTGRRVSVVWRPRAAAGDVLALDTETRDLAPQEATAALSAWVPLVQGLLYKKMDSTLRGPFAAEACALVRAKRMKGALYAPAFPSAGRTVIEGRLLLEGVPVAETQFGADPSWPVRESGVSLVVAAQTGRRPGHLTLAQVRGGADAIAEALDRSDGSAVADAETDADLTELARALLLRREWLPVGSAGLAGALAREMGFCHRVGEPAGIHRGYVLVCGSAHPASRRQVMRLTREVGIEAWTVGPGVSASLPLSLREAYSRTGLVALMAPPERLLGDEAGFLQDALAQAASQAVQELDARGIFVTGGQTLLAVLKALDVEELSPESEVAPGLVLSWAEADGGRRLQVISKAGGFGEEDVLLRLFCEGEKP